MLDLGEDAPGQADEQPRLAVAHHVLEAVERAVDARLVHHAGRAQAALERRRHTLKAGDTFLVCDHFGDMNAEPGKPEGLYHNDMRHLSRLTLAVCGAPALPLSADSAIDVYAGGIRKMTARLASEHGRLMVQIEERCDPATAAATGAN